MSSSTLEQTTPVVAPANRLDGKVAVVTGGTRGIGFAIAKAYLREGAKVVIASRTAKELKDALHSLRELGGNVTATRVDLSTPDGCQALYTGAIRAYGKVDVLVNNAGILGPRKDILDYPNDEWARVMRTNLDSVFWMSKAALGSMIPGNGGSIINVSSGVAKRGRGGWGAYGVSKAGVENLTQVLADEVKKYGIRVNAVNPGPTRTMMREEAYPAEPADQLPGPDEIVNPFIYLAADVSKGLTGESLESRDWMGRRF